MPLLPPPLLTRRHYAIIAIIDYWLIIFFIFHFFIITITMIIISRLFSLSFIDYHYYIDDVDYYFSMISLITYAIISLRLHFADYAYYYCHCLHYYYYYATHCCLLIIFADAITLPLLRPLWAVFFHIDAATLLLFFSMIIDYLLYAFSLLTPCRHYYLRSHYYYAIADAISLLRATLRWLFIFRCLRLLRWLFHWWLYADDATLYYLPLHYAYLPICFSMIFRYFADYAAPLLMPLLRATLLMMLSLMMLLSMPLRYAIDMMLDAFFLFTFWCCVMLILMAAFAADVALFFFIAYLYWCCCLMPPFFFFFAADISILLIFR